MTDDTEQGPLTGKELAKLRKVIDHADQIDIDMKFKAAKRVVWKATKTLILGAGATVISLAIVWDKVEAGAKWVFR